MSYASIMVAVDLGEHARERVRLAGHLADDFNARLIGVAAEMPAYEAVPVGPTLGSAYCIGSVQEAVLNDLRLAHEAFEEAGGGRSRVEWRSNLDFPAAFLARQSAAADLLVVGRGDDGSRLMSVDPGDALMRLGLPMLVVPPKVGHLDAKRVAVAWKDTREARRAVRDALPFLKRASQVVVISVDEGKGSDDTRDVIGLLQAHDVDATAVHRDAYGAVTADALIEPASEQAADLIVLGGYGHGRLREWAFGGVTRDLLAGCPVCCLMSH
ncbi:universal stress protein [Methylorubrum extorquens]|uniref:Universal stress protein, UspA n=1 Tax=Methylorubrum extorquens (strain ATCC 14718 / DSM 1338 / JCM 2805 / NCIMB 9133 / AM1) TaxID=272630 RepID=C5AZW8_METEA|nr:universal stress protein [Methylorubrum extorquens]ACS41492.1 putative Universal stress protein, UspA [Methylorubrum extorquens AM1]MCP1540318.1 nucleotide-binding universal stress UspA family protein [Methylorubrum extorquens]MCP1587145.1 nucleotide-binding universal stress UspA family protein [Methylorubrum extorquens]